MIAATTTDPIQDVIAAGVLVTAIYGAVNSRQNRRQANKLEDVHSLVNAQLTESVERRDVAEARTKVLEDEAKGGD